MKFLKDLNKNKSMLLMALPGMAWYILICYVPMFGIVIAFKNFNYVDGIFGSPWSGFENFKYLFSTTDAFVITRNTILYNAWFIVFGIVHAAFIAILFDMLGKTKLSRINQTVVLLPHFLSWVVASYFTFGILSVDKGIANQIVRFFGGENINWYAETKYWPFIIAICREWKAVGYASIVYYSTIRGFDVEYYEAAKIDGANWFQSITRITIPLMKPIITIMFILNIGSVMRSDFGLFYIIPKNSGLLYSVTSTLDTYIYNGMTGLGDMGSTAAAGLYQSVIGFLLVVGSNFIVRKISPEDALF
ncbi:MAG: sugar ABC transporter permease [Clostridia bacterium]|nr:sugar ABC transporter permease [Clostridia bacterium]